MKKIKEYEDMMDSIKDNIKKDLNNLDENNFNDILSDFGYKCEILKINQEDDEKELEKLESEKLKKTTGVYIFKAENHNQLTQKKWENFKNYMKEEKDGENKIPSWNKKEPKINVFYVGKSNKLPNRIKQHITSASKSTYALKLECYQKYIEKIRYEVYIFYLKNESNNKRGAINELVEAVLHESLKPSIGSK